MTGEKKYDTLEDGNPFELLAAAIVKQAIADYYATRREMMLYRRGGAAWERERCNLYLIEKWFSSAWCNALTFGQGEMILQLIKRGEL